MKQIFLFASALFLVWIPAGCAYPSSTISPAHPVLLRKAADMDYILVATTSALAGLESEQRVFNDRVISALRETALFPEVSANSPTNSSAAGIKIQVRITAIRKVSDAARLWYGGLAGEASVVAQVAVSDLGSGQEIEAFEVEGKSGKSAKAGTTNAAVERAAEQVAAEVLHISSASAQ